jgi:catechol 2,3-dioxygenase-like lactoylglutathione lyase family enzyme
MSAITHLFAGVPVSDLDASVDWYTRFFGRPPDSRVGEEVLWEIDERAWLFIEHEPIETYSNGVRHVNVPDPDGNAIAFAEPPDAASAGASVPEPPRPR